MEFITTEGVEMTDAPATMPRLYNIFEALRKARPDTYADDFRLILDAFSTNGYKTANALVTVLLAEAA